MSALGYFKTHRTWEDWLGMLLGVLIVLSPWFPMQADHEMVDAERSLIILNAFTIGILVFGLAQLEYVALQRWEEVAEIALGVWLIASPYIFGYSGDGLLRFWHWRRSAQVLAFQPRRTGGAAGNLAAVAGLGPQRPGPGQARAIATCRLLPPVWQRAGGPLLQ
jgi:hypothetical protein